MAAKLLLVDDHPVFRQGLHMLLGQHSDFEIVAETNNGSEAIEAIRKEKLDLVVMDITMPNMDGIEATREIKKIAPDTKVVALSAHSGKQFVRDMVKAGASGYILKESVPEEMVAGIRSVLKGDVYLSSSISNVLLTDYKNLIAESQPQPFKLGSSLLSTKLHRPPISVDIIPRVRLVELLEKGVTAPITLISAPAGYGKSIAASHWMEVTDRPSCWVSLEDSENDLRLLLSYIVEAVQTIYKDHEFVTGSLLDSGSLPSIEMIARYLLHDIDSLPEPFILVLDDYHNIRNQKVHDLVTELINQSSANMHIVLSSRRDPPLSLTSLRSQGKLTEITAKHLRFTVTETQNFLERFLHISISHQTALVLEAKMEGWITGLHLAALSIKNQEDQERLIEGLQATSRVVRDYLIQEVLATVPKPYRWFLLRTSLLDRFCPSLCDSLTSVSQDFRSDNESVTGWDYTHWLTGTNLFVIELDSSSQWFRFHHLFQELLQNQLQSEITAEQIEVLHLQASSWFEKRGLVDEALKHALSAKNFEEAADIFTRHREDVVNADQWYHLEKWLELIPETLVIQRPVLLMARAWVLMHHFRFENVFSLVEQVEQMIAEDTTADNLRGEIALCRGYCLFFMGDGVTSIKHLEKALKWVPGNYYEARAQIEIIYALSTQMVGDKERAIHFLDDLVATYNSPELLRKTRLLITYVFIHYISGNTAESERANQRLKIVVDQGEYAYVAAWTAHMQGLIHLHRCEWEMAIKQLGYSVDQRFIHFHRTGIDSIVGLMMAYQATGDLDKAEETLITLREFVASLDEPSLQGLVESAEARLAILQGRQEIVSKWLNNSDFNPEGAMIWWLDLPSLTRCRALITVETPNNLMEAQERLVEFAKYNENHHNIYQLITICTLQSIVSLKQDNRDQALQYLEQAITHAQPGNFQFQFIELGQSMKDLLSQLPEPIVSSDFVKRIFSSFQSTTFPSYQSVAQSETDKISPTDIYQEIETLTNREVDVLELLSRRLQNKEIASELFIAPETVKGHLKHIYQKLGVSGRRKAIEKARAMKII